ncbi:unnamed protein product, partial [Musa hybrid cultivar]
QHYPPNICSQLKKPHLLPEEKGMCFRQHQPDLSSIGKKGSQDKEKPNSSLLFPRRPSLTGCMVPEA